MDKQNFIKNEAFIDRMIDLIHHHYDPLHPTVDERGETHSLWRITTPKDYLITHTSGGTKDIEIRYSIHQALNRKQFDNALFLMLILSRLENG